MGLITGSIHLDMSTEELAYSEDSGVVAGEVAAGTGWRPLGDFAKVTPEADVVTVRCLSDKERTQYRNWHARKMAASANVEAVSWAVVRVTATIDGKVQRLKGDKALEWVRAVERTNPTAIDLLADRIMHRTAGRDPAELYPTMRAILGYPEPDPEDEGKEVGDDVPATKSEADGA